ncbi:Cytochrome p450 86a2, partial [Globisporangium splendens]
MEILRAKRQRLCPSRLAGDSVRSRSARFPVSSPAHGDTRETASQTAELLLWGSTRDLRVPTRQSSAAPGDSARTSDTPPLVLVHVERVADPVHELRVRVFTERREFNRVLLLASHTPRPDPLPRITAALFRIPAIGASGCDAVRRFSLHMRSAFDAEADEAEGGVPSETISMYTLGNHFSLLAQVPNAWCKFNQLIKNGRHTMSHSGARWTQERECACAVSLGLPHLRICLRPHKLKHRNPKMAPRNDESAALVTEKELFVKAPPPLRMVMFPVGWLWRWFSRRTGLFCKKWETESHSSDGAEAQFCMDGIVFGEGPRFRVQENALYFADMLGQKVLKFDVSKRRGEVVCEMDDLPSGLGWLPDGRLLIASGKKRQLVTFDAKTKALEVYADISKVTDVQVNDMVVGTAGQAYVGNFGFDHKRPFQCKSTTLVRVDTGRNVTVESTKMMFPNGTVITPDGKTLVIAETLSGFLTAFDVAKDGSLSNRRIWANVGMPPDGICLDAEGCVWVAIPHIGIYNTAGGLVRIREGGEVVDVLGFSRNGIKNGVFACQLGTDAEGVHHLFFLEASTSHEDILLKQTADKRRKNSVLKSIQVRVGPARSAANTNYSGGYC